jgi:hypothetical protein
VKQIEATPAEFTRLALLIFKLSIGSYEKPAEDSSQIAKFYAYTKGL